MAGRSIAYLKQLFQVSLDSVDSSRHSNNCSSDLLQSSIKETIKANGIYISALALDSANFHGEIGLSEKG